MIAWVITTIVLVFVIGLLFSFLTKEAEFFFPGALIAGLAIFMTYMFMSLSAVSNRDVVASSPITGFVEVYGSQTLIKVDGEKKIVDGVPNLIPEAPAQLETLQGCARFLWLEVCTNETQQVSAPPSLIRYPS